MSEVESRVRSSERSCAIAVLSKLFGGTVQAVAVFGDCVVLGLWLKGLNSVVKPFGGWGAIVLVSSSWLVALCKQLLCSVIARSLGSGCGLRLGRQAAWRPGYNRDGVVSSDWWHCACSCCVQ